MCVREREIERLHILQHSGKFPFLENRESFGKRQIISMFKYMI